MKVKCSRTACNTVCELPYVHTQSGLEYCAKCARRINEACLRDVPTGVCVLKYTPFVPVKGTTFVKDYRY